MEKIQRQNVLSETDKSESDLQEAFKHLDKDNDGLVTYDDVVTALKNEGVRDSHKVRKEISDIYKEGMNYQQFYDLVLRQVMIA